MKAEKKVIANLEKCYALGTFRYDGKDHVIAAAEKSNPCYSFDLQGNLCDTLWEGPGGVMTVCQAPGQPEPILMATQKFFSPDESTEAKIVYYRRVDEAWKCELLCEMPFVHRFGVLERGGRYYLIVCTLKSAHAFDGDWTCPGRVWVAPLPEDLRQYNAENQLKMKPLLSGLYKNHGFEICRDANGSFAVIGCENGVYQVTPPVGPEDDWTWEQLFDRPTSDMLYLDFDGDGERELLTLAPFHGDELSVWKRSDGVFREVWRHPKRLPFLHAIWGAEIGGRVYGFIGNRDADRDLYAVYRDGDRYVFDTLDQGAGAANVMHFRTEDGQDMLLAANRETDEVAVYRLET